MAETNPKEHTYSNEPLATTSIQAPAEISAGLGTCVASAASPDSLPEISVAGLQEMIKTVHLPAPKEVTGFFQRTKRIWLSAAGVILGAMALLTLMERGAAWLKNARERRMELAVATVTPDRLIARCGSAMEDETKEVYPIVMRTMSYGPRGQERLVMAFSRTAEEKSDWVFLSMQDANGGMAYVTPEAKIAALPCLDSKK